MSMAMSGGMGGGGGLMTTGGGASSGLTMLPNGGMNFGQGQSNVIKGNTTNGSGLDYYDSPDYELDEDENEWGPFVGFDIGEDSICASAWDPRQRCAISVKLEKSGGSSAKSSAKGYNMPIALYVENPSAFRRWCDYNTDARSRSKPQGVTIGKQAIKDIEENQKLINEGKAFAITGLKRLLGGHSKELMNDFNNRGFDFKEVNVDLNNNNDDNNNDDNKDDDNVIAENKQKKNKKKNKKKQDSANITNDDESKSKSKSTDATTMYTETKIVMGEYMFTPEDCLSVILSTVRTKVEEKIKYSTRRAFFSVPSSFSDHQRVRLGTAASLVGIIILRMVSSPLASFIGAICEAGALEKASKTSNKKSKDKEKIRQRNPMIEAIEETEADGKDEINVLVVDIGSGSMSMSIIGSETNRKKARLNRVLDIPLSNFEVLATYGRSRMGGEDLDQLIMEYSISKSNDKKEMSRRKKFWLRRSCRKAREILSEEETTKIEYNNQELSRKDLDKIIVESKFYTNFQQGIEMLLSDVSMKPEDLDLVFICGGVMQTPILIKYLEDKFCFGKKNIMFANYDTYLVADGASCLRFLSCRGSNSPKTFQAKEGKDVLPLNVGYVYNNIDGMDFTNSFAEKDLKMVLTRNSKITEQVTEEIIDPNATLSEEASEKKEESSNFSLVVFQQVDVGIDEYKPVLDLGDPLNTYNLDGEIDGRLKKADIVFTTDKNGVTRVSRKQEKTLTQSINDISLVKILWKIAFVMCLLLAGSIWYDAQMNAHELHKERLFHYFKDVRPEQVYKVDELLREWSGKEFIMYKHLERKYGKPVNMNVDLPSKKDL